jgi:hypothetical protein
MRGFGVPINGVQPTQVRRSGEGTVVAVGSQSKSLSTWDLVSTELPAAIQAVGYLNSMASEMSHGDIVEARMALGSATPVLKEYIVSIANGVVTLNLQTTTA